LWHTNPASAQVSTEAAPGTTIKVNSKGDGTKTGNCTLREAIEAANTNLKVDGCAAGSSTDRDAIHFVLGEKATITLGSLLPTFSDDAGLTINGQKNKITVSGNDEVRVFTVEGEGAKLNLKYLTVADGKREGAGGGGLLNQSGEVKVRNSTFSGNSVSSLSDQGGGILNTGTLKVANSTFSDNSAWIGGGISSGGPATLKNTIVANTPVTNNCTGAIIDGGHNIADDTSCGFSSANNSMPSTNPLLAASLANNGGPTKTIKLLEGSPAINAIPEAENGCGTGITTDQRGVKRPQGNGCDIGSFEKKQ
jgi:CSLREA domain-containing protein